MRWGCKKYIVHRHDIVVCLSYCDFINFINEQYYMYEHAGNRF